MHDDLLTTFASDVIDRCRKAGADAAEIYIRRGFETEIKVRNQEIETLQEGSPKSIGIRVWRGDRSASTYGTDFGEAGVDRLIGDAVELAALTDPVPELALPDAERLVREGDLPDLDIFDPAASTFPAAKKLDIVRTCEQAAFDADSRVSISGGASYGDLVMEHVLANSHGFCRGYRESYVSYSVQMVADDADNKKRRGFWYSLGRHLDQLEDPADVGRIAAERTARQLGARPIETGALPVVFDPLAGAAFVGMLFSVLTGRAIERRSSYLVDRVGDRIASEMVTIVDDPTRPRGPASRPYDGEGLPARPTTFVDAGVLKTYALNSTSARRLGLEPTGHASRPATGAPGERSSNLYLQPGEATPEEILAPIGRGLYVDSMMGFGFNPATGDFSRGASGFLIEDGKLTQPVSEVTVSANFDAILGGIEAVADDLDERRSTAAPTFRVAKMTIGGAG